MNLYFSRRKTLKIGCLIRDEIYPVSQPQELGISYLQFGQFQSSIIISCLKKRTVARNLFI